ncbi:IS110 family transposase [Poseidonocella sp. HB161398]|uniref:IS110 family transposase n=1 Tax=Poseidonocella sp. HB161398 TaxID=2320855 RepID=UPI00351398F9
MEACGTAHHWARLLSALGHDVCLISPKFAKPFAKTQSEAGSGTIRGTVPPPGDMADAEAIAEAAIRPTMRFAEIKTPGQQGLGMIFRLRDMLVGQRTQMINSLRGHLSEFGIVAGKGRETVAKLRPAEEASESLPASVRAMSQLCLEQIDGPSERISDLDAQIQAAIRRTPLSARLRKMPGIGPVTAMAVAAFAPPMEAFGRGRDFPAWLGVRSVSRADRFPARTAETAFERRQAEAGPNRQVRAERCRWPLGPVARPSATPAPADHWRDGGDFQHQGAAACREFVALPHPCAQAADAGGDRAGQQ